MTVEKQTNEEMCADAEAIVKELRANANEIWDAMVSLANRSVDDPSAPNGRLERAMRPFKFLIE